MLKKFRVYLLILLAGIFLMSCNTAGAEETTHYYRGRVIYLESSKSPHCPATTEQKAEVLLIGGKYAGKLVVGTTLISKEIFILMSFLRRVWI